MNLIEILNTSHEIDIPDVMHRFTFSQIIDQLSNIIFDEEKFSVLKSEEKFQKNFYKLLSFVYLVIESAPKSKKDEYKKNPLFEFNAIQRLNEIHDKAENCSLS